MCSLTLTSDCHEISTGDDHRWPRVFPTWLRVIILISVLSCSQNNKWVPGKHWDTGQPSPSHHHFWWDAYICLHMLTIPMGSLWHCLNRIRPILRMIPWRRSVRIWHKNIPQSWLVLFNKEWIAVYHTDPCNLSW